MTIGISASVVHVICAKGGAAGKVSASLLFASSFLLNGNLALYHGFNWGPKVKMVRKRIDEAKIVTQKEIYA